MVDPEAGGRAGRGARPWPTRWRAKPGAESNTTTTTSTTTTNNNNANKHSNNHNTNGARQTMAARAPDPNPGRMGSTLMGPLQMSLTDCGETTLRGVPTSISVEKHYITFAVTLLVLTPFVPLRRALPRAPNWQRVRGQIASCRTG